MQTGPAGQYVFVVKPDMTTEVRKVTVERIEGDSAIIATGLEKGERVVTEGQLRLGAGAKVVGAVSIGDGARVGANAVVVKDVPAHSTVVGIPAQVVRRRNVPDVNADAGAIAMIDHQSPEACASKATAN